MTDVRDAAWIHIETDRTDASRSKSQRERKPNPAQPKDSQRKVTPAHFFQKIYRFDDSLQPYVADPVPTGRCYSIVQRHSRVLDRIEHHTGFGQGSPSVKKGLWCQLFRRRARRKHDTANRANEMKATGAATSRSRDGACLAA